MGWYKDVDRFLGGYLPFGKSPAEVNAENFVGSLPPAPQMSPAEQAAQQKFAGLPSPLKGIGATVWNDRGNGISGAGTMLNRTANAAGQADHRMDAWLHEANSAGGMGGGSPFPQPQGGMGRGLSGIGSIASQEAMPGGDRTWWGDTPGDDKLWGMKPFEIAALLAQGAGTVTNYLGERSDRRAQERELDRRYREREEEREEERRRRIRNGEAIGSLLPMLQKGL